MPSNKEIYDLAETLRPEWVVEIKGQIVKRPENMVNPKIETGQVEMSVESFKVLSESETLPFLFLSLAALPAARAIPFIRKRPLILKLNL